MQELISSSAFFGVVLSLAAFEVGRFLRKRWNHPLCNPLLIAILLVIACLFCTGLPYSAYNASARYLSYLLTPATVCLAIPLYQRVSLLKMYYKAILTGILAGVLTSLVSVFLLCLLFGLTAVDCATLLPKSVTTAIGMELAEELGGSGSLAAAAIIITGVLGSVIAPSLCKLLHITEPVAVGIGIGTASHAIGTSKAMELGETEGAMSSLAIVVSGILTVVGASVFAALAGAVLG